MVSSTLKNKPKLINTYSNFFHIPFIDHYKFENNERGINAIRFNGANLLLFLSPASYGSRIHKVFC